MLRPTCNSESFAEHLPATQIGDWEARRSVGLDSRFEIHDENQVELKLDYSIDTDSKWTRYQTEAFIFVPKSLGIDRDTYDRSRFFQDTHAYIRFKTPQLRLSSLVDPDSKASPLRRIQDMIGSSEASHSRAREGRLAQELRMFGCLVRANLRDAVGAVASRMEEWDSQTSRIQLLSDISSSIMQIADEVDDVCAAFRELRPHLAGVGCPPWLREHFEFTDEFLSITVENYLTDVLVALESRKLRDKRKYRELSESMWNRLVATISHEQEHRKQAGYGADLSSKSGRKNYVRRSSTLKKFITSVLFLKISPRSDGAGVVHIVAGIAAALAMAFSTAAAILSERVWGINSLPFVLAIVIAYVFKDRIKDWVKGFFSSKVARWLPDRSLSIVDPANGFSVGRCRESFAYLDQSRTPDVVKRWRYAGSDSLWDPERNPEVLLHYVKDIAIRGKRIGKLYGRLRGINDIIRWNVSSFLGRMDDPERVVEFFDRETQELKAAVCPKQYELNVVLVLKAGKRPVSIQRFRIVLDRNGIRALESVEMEPATRRETPEMAQRVGS